MVLLSIEHNTAYTSLRENAVKTELTRCCIFQLLNAGPKHKSVKKLSLYRCTYNKRSAFCYSINKSLALPRLSDKPLYIMDAFGTRNTSTCSPLCSLNLLTLFSTPYLLFVPARRTDGWPDGGLDVYPLGYHGPRGPGELANLIMALYTQGQEVLRGTTCR